MYVYVHENRNVKQGAHKYTHTHTRLVYMFETIFRDVNFPNIKRKKKRTQFEDGKYYAHSYKKIISVDWIRCYVLRLTTIYIYFSDIFINFDVF